MKNTLLLLGKRITPREGILYLKFFLSKYTYEGITEDLQQKVWMIYIDLLESFPKNQNIKGICQLDLVEIGKGLKYLKFNGQPKGGERWLHPIFKSKFFLNPHEYFGLKHQNTEILILKRIRFFKEMEKPFPKSPRYIGVGYKDKGNLRNTSVNGNPHWKEVATYFSRKSGLNISSTDWRFEDPNNLRETMEIYFPEMEKQYTIFL